jgi:hypothetical protein
MLEDMKKFAQKFDKDKHDSSVVAILTHGNDGGVVRNTPVNYVMIILALWC